MKNIGIDVIRPESTCEDAHCPFCGSIKLRGRVMTAKVVASKVPKTATVERTRRQYLPKYNRFTKRKSKIRVHNPECISAKEGDEVLIVESRPISKTKKFVIVQKNEINKK